MVTRADAALRGEAGVGAVRGATTVRADEARLIHEATTELLLAMLDANALRPAQLVSAIFTMTPDLTTEFPARAARDLGWRDVPLLCAQEIAVPGALARCIRVLLHARVSSHRAPLRPVYLRDAVVLRPELAMRFALWDGHAHAADAPVTGERR